MKEAVLVFEWKGVSSYLERKHGLCIPIKTLKRWHKTYLEIPFEKTAKSHTGRIIVPTSTLDAWLRIFRQNFPYLYNVKRNALVK